MIPFTMSDQSLTVYLNGVPKTAHTGTLQYNQIRDAILKQEWDKIPGLFTVEGALQRYLGERFHVKGEAIRYLHGAEDNGRWVDLPSVLNARIQAMALAGEDPTPLLRFYERLAKNPSFRSREQAFNFLQHLDIAIEPDGTFLAYKGVNSDYTDCHTGTIPNTPGMVHTMDRNLVSDDPEEACHYGFHVGAREYAHSFGRGVTMICRVDPADIVCVPNDYSCQKMRVCKYEVVGEWNGVDMNVVDTDDFDDYEVEVSDLDDYNVEDDEDLDDAEDDLYGASDDEPVQHTEPCIFTPTERTGLDAVRLTKGLMEQSIEALRRYATHDLKIVGASKIPGGKSALVAKIMKTRRNRGL